MPAHKTKRPLRPSMPTMPGLARRLEACEQLQVTGYVVWQSSREHLRLCARARLLLGLPPRRPLSLQALQRLLPVEAQQALMLGEQDALARREPVLRFEATVRQGRRVRVVMLCRYADDGQLHEAVAALQDVTEQHAILSALSDREARLQQAERIARVGYWEWNFHTRKAHCSDEALRIFSRPRDWNPTLQDLVELLPQEQRPTIVALFESAFRERRGSVGYDWRHTDEAQGRHDVHTLANIEYDHAGKPARILAAVQDVTELTHYRQRLHTLSFFDAVTDLPNRALLNDRLRQAVTDAGWRGKTLGVAMLDLDRFKHINDSLGHAAGDALLKQAAQRLQAILREYDTVARLGGDEFAIVLPEVRHATDLGSIAYKILQAFAEPFHVAGKDVFATASIGAALYPEDAQDAEQLLQFADAALYHAKAKGRNKFQFYSRELTEQASARLTLESELRKGIERGELQLYYQPKFELSSGRLVGAEALMRWQHPERGLVPPMDFISLAEDTGLIVPMGAWALNAACRAVADWNRRGAGGPRRRSLKVAVNLSARQFGDGDLGQVVRTALRASSCRPAWLELEITESLLLDGQDEVRQVLEDISALGVSIAMDDFGTGYSALSYLTRFPVQTLKIDRSFVKELPADRSSAELVKAIVSLGKSLNMALVAEGVETQEQAQHLSRLGCQLVQGYLYGRPLPEAAFLDLLGRPAAVPLLSADSAAR